MVSVLLSKKLNSWMKIQWQQLPESSETKILKRNSLFVLLQNQNSLLQMIDIYSLSMSLPSLSKMNFILGLLNLKNMNSDAF